MELKQYFNQQQKEKSARKYNIRRIEYAYTREGFFAPFVFNNDKTKVKDIETGKIVILKDGEYSYDNVKQALSELFSIDADKVEHNTVLYVIKNFTFGVRIPGKIFKDVRNEIYEDFHDRKNVINYGSINDLMVTVYDLKPLTQELSEDFASLYKTRTNGGTISSNME